MRAARSAASVGTWTTLTILLVVAVSPSAAATGGGTRSGPPALGAEATARSPVARPGLSIEATDIPGTADVALSSAWAPGGCAVAPVWYSWSLPTPGPVAFLAGNANATTLLAGSAVASGWVTVRLLAAASTTCGSEVAPELAEANASVFVAPPPAVGPVSVGPDPVPLGSSVNLSTNISGAPPFVLALDWGDGTVEVTNLSASGPIHFAHLYASGTFWPSVVVRDALGRVANATVPESVAVGTGPALRLTTAQPQSVAGALVPFVAAARDLAAGTTVIDTCGGAPPVRTEPSGTAFACRFATPGIYRVAASIISTAVTTLQAVVNETVVPAPTLAGPTAPIGADAGAAVVVPVGIQGGVAPFHVTWTWANGTPAAATDCGADGPCATPFAAPAPGVAYLTVALSDATGAAPPPVPAVLELAAPPNVTGTISNATGPTAEALSLAGQVVGGAPPYDLAVLPSVSVANQSADAWAAGPDPTFVWNASTGAEGAGSLRLVAVDGAGELVQRLVPLPLVPALQVGASLRQVAPPSGNVSPVTVSLALRGGLPPFDVALAASTGVWLNGTVAGDGNTTWNLSAPANDLLRCTISVEDALGAEQILVGELLISSQGGSAPPSGPNGTAPGVSVSPAGTAEELGALVGVVAAGAGAVVLYLLRRRRRPAAPSVSPDPGAVLRELIAPADGAERGTIELLAEEAGVPMATVSETIDRMIADGRLRSERTSDGEQLLTWSGEADR